MNPASRASTPRSGRRATAKPSARMEKAKTAMERSHMPLRTASIQGFRASQNPSPARWNQPETVRSIRGKTAKTPSAAMIRRASAMVALPWSRGGIGAIRGESPGGEVNPGVGPVRGVEPDNRRVEGAVGGSRRDEEDGHRPRAERMGLLVIVLRPPLRRRRGEGETRGAATVEEIGEDVAVGTDDGRQPRPLGRGDDLPAEVGPAEVTGQQRLAPPCRPWCEHDQDGQQD